MVHLRQLQRTTEKAKEKEMARVKAEKEAQIKAIKRVILTQKKKDHLERAKLKRNIKSHPCSFAFSFVSGSMREDPIKNRHFRNDPLTKEKAKDHGKEISHAPIRNTKIKDLMQVVNPLKERKVINHRSKMIAPMAARNGSLTRGK